METHRTRSWRALTGGYDVETVEDCIAETQTGLQHRRRELRIEARELRDSLEAIYPVEDRERAELAVRIPDIAMDRGEASLWAHALSRDDAWVLCGPDRASLRCGVRLGFRDRLVSLERLLEDAGYRSSIALRPAYTVRWHERILGELVLMQEHAPTE